MKEAAGYAQDKYGKCYYCEEHLKAVRDRHYTGVQIIFWSE